VTGRSARFAGAGTALPIVVSPAASRVDAHGAVLGVPARDRWAQAIADRLDGADRSDPGPDVVLRPAVRWRLRDFSISRQRSWGAPVPMLHCGQCGAVPVPDEQLPVLLPEDPPSDRASQGAEHDAVGTCRCPRCGGHARRDPDTLDCHLDSFWMLVPFCVPAAARDRSMFTHADLAYWLPAYQVVCGVDQASWWLNDRLTFRALRDLGFLRGVQGDEPIASLATHEMVLCEGVKMSKSRGNAVDPDAMVVRFGADAVRLAVLATPSHRPLEWDDAIVARQRALLERVWSLCARLLHDPRPPAITRRAASSRHRAWTAAAIRQTTRACESRRFDAALRSIETLTSTLWRCQEEGRRAFGADEGRECVSVLARLLEPLAPHIAEELWSQLGAANDCAAAPWPVAPPTQSGGNHRPAAERGSHCQS
jgi:leucyl-tRNA synthetase